MKLARNLEFRSWLPTMLVGLGMAHLLGPIAAAPPTAQNVGPTAIRPSSPTVDSMGGSLPGSVPTRHELFTELQREVQGLEQQSAILRKVVEFVRPSVVHIEADKRSRDQYAHGSGSGDGPGPLMEEAGSGTFVMIGGNPYVLTNRHVIRDADWEDVRVQLADGRVLHPQRIWADRATDVAVVKIEGGPLIPARLGNSDLVGVGDFVLAFGSPFGLNHSVTHGIISATGRRELQLGEEEVHIQDFLQTDAAINPGNSGGPLLNLRGEVIGINTAIASNSGGNEGIGFSIPINLAMVVARQLVENGALVRAYLGVQLEAEFNATDAEEIGLPYRHGTRVSGVTANSPADSAEIRAGDVILQFGDALVEDDSHLVNLVGLTPVGRIVPLLLFREGAERTVFVTLESRHRDTR